MSVDCRMDSQSPHTAVVAVVIPAYRAERTVAQVIAGLPSFISLIIVVDDCSPDRTAEVVTRAAASDARIRLVRHAVNQGVGGAVLSGYRHALELGADVIVKMDSDLQMDPAELPALLGPILQREADYTKGNRFLHARQLTSMPLVRRIGNLGLSFLTKLASGYWGIFDPTNGYTAISARVAELLDQDAISRRYFFETSMLAELGMLRGVVRDVPMPARYQDEISHLSVRRTLVEFPGRLLRCLLRRIWVQYFVRDFGLFTVLFLGGSALALFGAASGTLQWIASAYTDRLTSTGTVMISVLPLILGVQFLLQSVLLDVQNAPLRPLQRDLVDDAEVRAILRILPEGDENAGGDRQTLHRRVA